ncbi:CHAT domain-containing protein [Myxococcus sp. RHSTA-1-4]|uniref:nSTAND1 domain-containing NTPase n=1 Tax=Myxococcus sp. RHSTA-1-4 TaxID=2874601 RepID=UPI001CBB13CA|nr:CHAT domain-containing protein [Myxococcus sp. RHSTA-1-4]MBZ4415748.1 CHAT domain-containing protein [Myxococcus sp. RHSTA-1-4]
MNAPIELLLELVRGEESEDAFHFQPVPQEYLLRRGHGSYASAALSWEPELLADLAELERLEPDRSVVQRLGDRLRSFLEQVGWDAQARDILAAVEQERPVHLTFRFAAAELYALPWELLTLGSSGRTLAELPGVLIRYEWPSARSEPPSGTARGGRILYAWSAAGGQVPHKAHLSALSQACEHGAFPFDSERDVVANVSLGALGEALARPGEPAAILHLLCHGGQRGQTQGLLWDTSWGGGEPELVDGAALRQLLAPHAGTLRLVVLAACRSGAGMAGNHLGSVAQALHRAGIQAVVASRLPLSIPGSVVLTGSLYESLLAGPCSLEEAVGHARRRLALDSASLDQASLQLYARAAHGSDTRPVALRPYRGLLPFQKEDHRFFFGREPLREELLQRVHESVEGKRPRFQVLAGAAGTGKSSLALAGLLPALPADTWDVHVLTPHPGYAEALQPLRQAPATRRQLLLVDPFEEAFTHLTEPEARRAFAAALWELSRDAERQVVVLATIRVDYLGRCGELVVDAAGTRLDTVMYSDAHRLFVTGLQGEGLRAAIERPALKVGLTFEPGLVDRLLQDVGQEPGALPLLQYALDQLWEEREGHQLTHRAYADIGGVAGALSRAADQLYAALSTGEQRQARRLLVELVDLQPGPSMGTRMRVRLQQLHPAPGEARDSFERVLAALLTARLLTRQEDEAGEAWLRISHESLIRTWPVLLEWARADRERVQAFRELQTWAQAWLAHREDADGGAPYLLSGSRLGYAQGILERYSEPPGEDVLRLLEASVARAGSQQRAFRRRMVGLLVAASSVAVMMAGLGAREQHERREAQRHALRARDLVRQGVARMLLHVNPTLALLILREVEEPEALRGWNLDATEVLQQPLSQAVLRGHDEAVVHVEVSPDGRYVATTSYDGTARLWSLDGKGAPRVLKGHGGPVHHATFSPPDGANLLTSSEDGTARLWQLSDGKLLRVFRHHGAVQWGAFSPDRRWVATASQDGRARVWSLESEAEPRVLEHKGPVHTVAFSPDGEELVTASQDGTARLWSFNKLEHPRELRHPDALTSAMFDPDGTHVLTASRSGVARVWPVEGREAPVVLAGHRGELTTARFSPDGQSVVTASVDGTARLWRVDDPEHFRELGRHPEAVRLATFSGPPGEWILTVSADTTARVWSTTHEAAPPRVLRGHRSSILWGAFSPDGTRAVTGSVDKTARVWRLDTPRDSLPLQEPGAIIWSVAFSPDGRRMATASEDHKVRVWSSDRRLLRTLEGHEDAVYSVSFSPDGRWLLTASQDGTVRLWPSDGSSRASRVLVHQPEPVSDAAFSPNGRWVAFASGAGLTGLVSVKPPLRAVQLAGHGDEVRSVAFSADGRQVLTASLDGTARIWSAEGRLLATLQGHDDWVLSAAFHPRDPARVLTSSQDGTARIWRVEGGGGVVEAIATHVAPVLWSAWSPDGSHFVTTCADARARLWKASDTAAPYLVLSAHDASVTSAAFTPFEDELRLLTGSEDGTARLWRPREPVSIEALQQRLREASSACLTAHERAFLLDDPPEQAREASAACERAHDRTPSETPH